MEEKKKTSTRKRTTKPKTTSSSTKKVSKTKVKETPKKSSYDIWMNIINCMETFYQNYLKSKEGLDKYKTEIRKYRFADFITNLFGCFIIANTIGHMITNGVNQYDFAFIAIAIIILVFKRIIFKMLMEAITGGHNNFYNNEQYKELKMWTDIPYFNNLDFKKLLECMFFCLYFNQLYPDKLKKIKETNLYKSTRSLNIKDLEKVVENGQFSEGLTKEDYKICSYYLLCRPDISLINMIIVNPLFIRTRSWCNMYSRDERKILSDEDNIVIHDMTLNDDIEQIGENPKFTEVNKYDFHSYFGLGISTFDKMLKLNLPEFKERVNKSYENNENSPFGLIIKAYNKAESMTTKYGEKVEAK